MNARGHGNAFALLALAAGVAVATGGPPAAAKAAGLPGEIFQDCDACPEMVVIPPGEFVMGSPEVEAGRYDAEGPQHTVRIERAFALGRDEVTVIQWVACVADGGCPGGRAVEQEPGQGADGAPAIMVSWLDAKEYVGWLSRVTGKPYRLASESEWEYAARAGTTGARFWGEDADGACANANVHDLTSREENLQFLWTNHECDDGYAGAAPVGSFAANGFGVRDMLGNVAEWVADCWNDTYAGAPSDGSEWSSGNCKSRILRGGSWRNAPRVVRAAFRIRSGIGYHGGDIGLRVAVTLAD